MPARFAKHFCLLTLVLAAALFAGRSYAATITGTVFEDVSYGGSAGRSRTASGGVGISGVRIEVYNGNNYVTAFNTGTNGTFSYTYSGNDPRTLRVVSGTVRSSRGTCTNCVPVQTFRTTGATNSNTVTSVTNRVGGENPALNDAPSNTSGATLPTLTTTTQRPQSITTIDPGNSGNPTVSNVDFGFNFSTIVNTRDAATCTPGGSDNSYFPCQGTLRQFLINAQALGTPASQNGSRQLGGVTSSLPSGYETSIFMIPLSSGAVSITLATALPALTRDNLRLDATTQTVGIGNTNSGSSGTGGSVGALVTAFPQFSRPEIQIADAVFSFTGANQAIHGFALPRGSITMSGINAVVRDNFVGVNASGNADSGGNMAIVFSGTNAEIRSNYASANNSVIRGNDPGAGARISFNEVIRSSSTPTDTFDGILLIGSATGARIENNLTRNQAGAGIELGFGGGSMNGVVITNNTVRQNGFSGAGAIPNATPSNEPVGIAAWSYTGSGNEISFNVIENNAGPGVMLSAASGTRLSQNRFSNNGGLSIDLYPTSVDPNGMGTANGPTLNDNGDADSGANGLLNFPVITAATIANGEFSVAGFARPGSAIELYVAQPDPTGFGEGLTYLGTFTEGIGDLDATTGTYSGTINGRNQGTDTTNRFLFRGSVPGGVSAGVVLTSTATLGGETSEFGGNVTVTGGPNLIHSKSVRVESDPFNNTSNPKSIPGSIQVYTIRIANQAGGTVDNNSIEIVDSIPANTVMCGLGSSVVTFQNGTPSSGLTFNAAGNVSYSSTAGTPPVWGYTPAPDASGCDAAIRHIRIRPQGTMAGSGGSGNPYFEVSFRVKVL